ncbi:Transcriptional regulator of beta-glucosides utilization, LacI family [Pseudoalteromonas luteoviolacea B = ATCC 29581]|nr:Transcriptional regulator of beta-glucosides utilization, LacI family [Pseudoalteromonas luteoviolacea B = ATCC 29581]
MATIYDVSVLAGVSLATVSRVINKNGNVSEKTAKKVLAAMEQLGYRPNAIAQSLASNRSNSVGILIPELCGPFFGNLMSGAEKRLRDANKHVIITAGHSKEESEKAGIDFLLSRNCDALILHLDALSDEYLVELSKRGIPIVVINRFVPSLQENCIYLDNMTGGYQATKEMIAQGHRDIAYIAGPDWKEDAKARFEGHKKALQEANIDFIPELIYKGDFKQESGSDGLKHLLSKAIEFTALVCANDEMASGAMAFAREHDIGLPDAISIIGFDNIVYSSYLFPALTTINYPVEEMAKMAAALILKEVYQVKGLKITNEFYPSLVRRQSVATLKN